MQHATKREPPASERDEIEHAVSAESAGLVQPPFCRHDDSCQDGDLESGLTTALTFSHVHYLVKNVNEYNGLNTKRNQLLLYVFLLLVYVGLNLGLLAANFEEQEVIEHRYYLPFHLSAFWGVFGFTILEALILLATGLVSWNNCAQSALLLFNVVITFATALFFTFDPELYEVPAHYMEYSVQVLVSGVNILFVNQSFPSMGRDSKRANRIRTIETVILYLVLALSVFQLSIFSGYPEVAMGPERSAHFCEFTNEIFNGSFALVYAIQCYNDVQEKLETHSFLMRSPSVVKRTE